MLEGLLKGLALWIYGLILSGIEYISNALLDVFQMDMAYFENAVPVSKDIFAIIVAVGWALLIGNLTFQAMKTMASGIGFEGEDPKILFCRTFVFGFLLLASRQICEIGMSISNSVIALLQVPTSVVIPSIAENSFSFDGSWLLVIIVGIVMMFQIVKFFFQMGERYVIMAILTILAPLAFGVGGSKSTEDIFKGWVRMFASMCATMVMNVVFLKILLSVMGTVPTGIAIIPWLILIVAIGRVARKIDDIISRIGMNSARTGEPLGKGNLPGMLTMMVAKNIMGRVAPAGSSRSSSAKAQSASRGARSAVGTAGIKQNPVSAPHSGTKSGAQSTANSNNFTQAGNHFNQNSSQNASQSTSQSAAQNMSNASNSHTNNSAHIASSVAGSAANSTIAGVQGGKVGRSVTPTGNIASQSDKRTQNVSRKEIGNKNNSTVTGTAAAGSGQRPPAQSHFGGSDKQIPNREAAAASIHQQTSRQEKSTAILAGTASAGTNSAGTTVPTRPPLGRSVTPQCMQASTGNIASHSVKETTSTSRTEGLGRNGATQQSTVNNLSPATSQNIPSPLGRNTGVAHATQSNAPARPSQNVPSTPSRNSPEIYSRSSAADVAPLQNSSEKNHNSHTKESVKIAHRPPIGRGESGNRGDRR